MRFESSCLLIIPTLNHKSLLLPWSFGILIWNFFTRWEFSKFYLSFRLNDVSFLATEHRLATSITIVQHSKISFNRTTTKPRIEQLFFIDFFWSLAFLLSTLRDRLRSNQISNNYWRGLRPPSKTKKHIQNSTIDSLSLYLLNITIFPELETSRLKKKQVETYAVMENHF